MIGKRVAHYTIVDQLGAGGMGEVYLATDGKLRRKVALKVLPEAFTADAERMSRFEREAQLLASLNHPGIGAIYGIEESDDVRCLVLELVEGKTLGELIEGRPLPIAESLGLALQICKALEAAHERGVIHRDLKPANVMITPEGGVKILDFGLAKVADGAGAAADVSSSPTLTAAATEAGFILGTAAYMSPEQAAAKPVDRRTDIWAFGVVLFEMLTGRRLYVADSVPETLASVIARDPDLEMLPDDLPPRIEELVRRCLRKDPVKRLRDIGDARIVIEEELSGEAEAWAPRPGPASGSPARRSPLPWIGAALLAAVVGAGLAWISKPAGDEPPLLKFEFEVVGGLSRGISPELSPDGSRMVYRAEDKLWVRDLARLEPLELAGVDSPHTPFWSPDGEWIGYGQKGDLWRVAASGGKPVLMAQTAHVLGNGSGAVWLEDGRIVFSPGDRGIYEVAERGGKVVSLLEPGEDELDFHDVSALPGGRGLLFVVHDETGFDTIGLLADGERSEVLTLEGQAVDDPRYVAGHLVFVKRAGTRGIWAAPFSLASREVTGEPFLVVPAGEEPSVSANGILAYVTSPLDAEMELVLVNRLGKVERSLELDGPPDGYPAFSPDGGQVASLVYEDGRQVWVLDLDRGGRTRITSGPASKGIPRWVSEHTLMFSVGTSSAPECHVTAADGSGTASKLSEHFCWDVSPDGETLLYTSRLNGGDILYGPSAGGEAVQFLASGETTMVAPQFSPDGRFVVYQSNESGRDEVFVRTFPLADRRWQVSTDGGHWPRWRDGEIFYVHDGRLFAVSAEITPALEVSLGVPEPLFEMPRTLGSGFNNWPDGFDVAGDRFVMRRPVSERVLERKIAVVQSWLEEFRAPD